MLVVIAINSYLHSIDKIEKDEKIGSSHDKFRVTINHTITTTTNNRLLYHVRISFVND